MLKVPGQNDMQNLIDKYYQPTPVKWRKIGDGMLAAATAALPLVGASPVVGGILTGMLILGKFLTNFFSESAQQ